MKKILVLSAGAFILLGATASPASADWHGGYGHWHGGRWRGGYYGGWYGYRGWGPRVPPPIVYAPPPVYYPPPPPVYYPPPPYYPYR